jgi:hypothetical protein
MGEFTLRLSYNMHGNRRHIHRTKKEQIVTMSAHLRCSAIVNKWEALVVDDVPVERIDLHSYVRPTSQAHTHPSKTFKKDRCMWLKVYTPKKLDRTMPPRMQVKTLCRATAELTSEFCSEMWQYISGATAFSLWCMLFLI